MTARTPEQDGGRLVAGTEPPSWDDLSGPRASRLIRKRLAFRADEALTERAGAKKRAAKAPSPWQRSFEAWRQAGVPWVDGNVPEDRAGTEPPPRAVVDAAAERKTAAAPDKEDVAAPEKDAAAPERKAAAVEAPARESAPAKRHETGLRRPSHTVVAVMAVLVVAAGAVAYALSDRGEEAGPRSAVAAAVSAEDRFTADPAAADGLVQRLANVTAHGSTVVATGTETAGDGTGERERAQFLVSGDGGRGWRLATVRTPDGDAPPPGDRPRLVAGGDGAWAAIGDTARPGKVALWTAVDVRSWTRETEAAPFGPNDRVNGLVRTASGFVAVGVHSPGGTFGADSRGVVWTSPDGRAWQRNDRLNVPGVSALGAVAASGDTLVAHGTVTRTVTRTVKAKGKRKARKVTTAVRGEGLWRSADGGRTWAPVTVPQAQGSYGPVRGLVAGPGGFYLRREGRSTTGSKKDKKKRKTTLYGVLFGSRDGASWAPVARLSVPGYRGVERLSGTLGGLAALVRGPGGKGTVLLSADGRTWRPGSEVGPPGTSGPGVEVTGLAVLQGGGAVLSGARDANGFLALAAATPGPVTPVDLTKVPGAVRPERTLNAIVQGPGGRLVVAGSSGGDAALWSTGGGSAWSRVRVTDPKAARAGGPGQIRRRLTDVAAGPGGWLAVGRVDAPLTRTSAPFVTTSRDGTSWSAVTLPGATATSGVVSGPGGHVVVGVAGRSPAAWHSTDLRRWTRGAATSRDALAGSGSMRDVTVASTGYVAVGGRLTPVPERGRAGVRPPTERPAVWTSADGRTWSAVASPALPPGLVSGSFFQVAARGGSLVALGSGKMAASPGAAARDTGFVARSADGGRTWVTGFPPGMDATTTPTAVTSTAKGFLLAATSGAPGREDVVLWTWAGDLPATADAADWRRVPSHGAGLDGPGHQRLTALTQVGGEVVGTGVSGDHRGETPMLWRTPVP
ncbi:hypothetical protein [Actinomadura sp. SCN-SB]|uniref:hypothetical protein n=1 Tax=Actinomadura sp. SCN-SB TaxID=3373092 RepID=UPI003750D256